jgi:ribosomal protein S18 acetylase RimI-like enzyme
MIDEYKKQLVDYDIATVTRENFNRVFEVYNTNQDFFLLTQGKEATIESSIDDVSALPPGCSIGQKIFISLSKENRAVGVLDIIMEYPDQDSFWIGLLLIRGDLHGKKIGSGIITATLNAAKAVGYKSAQLGVVENNTKAVNFWQRHGFNILRHSGNIVVMALRLGK